MGNLVKEYAERIVKEAATSQWDRVKRYTVGGVADFVNHLIDNRVLIDFTVPVRTERLYSGRGMVVQGFEVGNDLLLGIILEDVPEVIVYHKFSEIRNIKVFKMFNEGD